MIVSEALNSIHNRFLNIRTLKYNLVTEITAREFLSIKNHIKEQELEIDAGDRNAGDANDLINKQCKENDKLKEYIEEMEEIIISVNKDMSLFRCENAFEDKTFKAIQRIAREVIK